MSIRKLATKFTSADQSPGLQLWRVTNRWQAAQRAALKPYKITHVQFVLLASLLWLEGQTDEPIIQKDLADLAATDIMMTSQVIRTLEKLGLVIRKRHSTDGRARTVASTPRGSNLINKAILSVETCDELFFGKLSKNSVQKLTGLLTHLV